MKIAFPISDKSIDSNIHDSFGCAPYYLLYNTISKEINYLDHRAVVEQGGAGIRAAQVLADNGIKAIISPQCGENAGKILRKSEVLIYQSIPGTIKDNIEALIGNQLSLINDFRIKDNKSEK